MVILLHATAGNHHRNAMMPGIVSHFRSDDHNSTPVSSAFNQHTGPTTEWISPFFGANQNWTDTLDQQSSFLYALGQRQCLYSLHHLSSLFCASSGDRKQWIFRHSSRRLPLNDSINSLSVRLVHRYSVLPSVNHVMAEDATPHAFHAGGEEVHGSRQQLGALYFWLL